MGSCLSCSKASSLLRSIHSSTDFEVALLQHKLLVAVFSAPWCLTCQVFAPTLEDLAADYQEVTFLKINIDVCSDLVEEYEVWWLPTVIIFRDGVQRGRFGIGQEHQLREALRANLVT
ncbi:unnamed protein product [Mesocestoides corti]|uniref:Thioredoxin domain-containing protein n=1 Tax=Mesocestoides corti TaxID=53468 RepID=A0A0R3U8F7_MESCO|nr:unnamed protein product [Mesocestoides corti]